MMEVGNKLFSEWCKEVIEEEGSRKTVFDKLYSLLYSFNVYIEKKGAVLCPE